jgi:glutamyl-tRNA synthetase
LLRFAPSPTGNMNINNLRIAIINYILSKQLNEPLLIRIEDIDKEKNIEGKEKEILEILNLFSIEYSNVVYQSENLKYHQKLAMQLMGEKKAFACFCSDEKLKELTIYDDFCASLSDEAVLSCEAPFSVRIKKSDKDIQFTDLLKGDFEFKPSLMESIVILNRDKTPTYDYACAVDDMLYDVSLVIRDEKYLLNTAPQINIRAALNYDKEIKYLHLPTILIEDIDSVKKLIDEGYLPSAIANYLVLITSKNAPKEVFTLEEAIKWFDIKNIVDSAIEFDINKLKLINKKHLESIDELRLSKILGFADTDIGKLGKLFLNEVSTIKEIKEKIELIFSVKSTYEGFEKEFVELKLCVKDAPFFENFEEFKKYIGEKNGLKDEHIQGLLRYILTGSKMGPELSDIYPLIKNYLGEIVK